jgi:phosphatidylserine/phosphatidylglycerophosphate/cardiolipin synthase-like enzyme
VQLSALAARDRLWIASPYFVPDGNITQALIRAHENGAEVRVLTMSDATDKKWCIWRAKSYTAICSRQMWRFASISPA